MRREILQHRRGQNVQRVGILWQAATSRSQILFIGRINLFPKAWRTHSRIVPHVCHEGNADIRAVIKRHDCTASDIIQLATPNTEKRKSWGEQKESDAIPHIPVADLGDDRERRVIYNNGILVIGHRLIIAARIERTQHLRARQAITINGPIFNRRVNILRRVAVVRRFLWHEFLNKGLVVGVFVA